MSWNEAICWSFARAVLIGILGTWLAVQIVRSVDGLQQRVKIIAWSLMLLPFFVPSLVTGYCYRDTSMSLVHSPWMRELLYGVIVCAQSVPVAVVMLKFSSTPSASETAVFLSQRLQLPRLQRGLVQLRSARQYEFAACSLLTLLAFQEADLAALMQASGWSEWMFTKHAAGLALSETVRLSLMAIAVQLPFVVPVVLWLGQDNAPVAAVSRMRSQSAVRAGVAVLWVMLSVVVVVVFPGWQLVRGVWIGSGSLFEQPSLPREIGDALVIAGSTTLASLGLGLAVLKGRTRLSHGVRSGVFLLLLVPGLLGNLALGLVVSGIFQTSLLRGAYDSPVPLILAEVMYILPRTLILLHCLHRLGLPTANHVIGLLERSPRSELRGTTAELRWQLSGRLRFAAVAIVGFWAYFEVMLPSLLAMPGLAPVGLVLYNHLHYGRITALGAKLALALCIPVSLAVLFLLLRSRIGSHSSRL